MDGHKFSSVPAFRNLPYLQVKQKKHPLHASKTELFVTKFSETNAGI